MALAVLNSHVRNRSRCGIRHRVHDEGIYLLYRQLGKAFAGWSVGHGRWRTWCRILRLDWHDRSGGNAYPERARGHRQVGELARDRCGLNALEDQGPCGDDSHGDHPAQSEQCPLPHGRNRTIGAARQPTVDTSTGER